MKTESKSRDLIAPCGMNCAICSRYLSYLNGLKRSQCKGCRPGNMKCSYLFEKCSGMNSKLDGNADAGYCFTCDQYPCKQISRMDGRYRKYYNMSVKDNLKLIEEIGPNGFMAQQYEKYKCSKCGGFISIHNRKCFKCDIVTKLVVKHS